MAPEQPQLLPGIVAPGSLTLFRYCSYDVPFWARPNARPGRWHVVGDEPTQYWSMTPEAAWAELVRAENLQIEADLDLVRMPIWVCRIAAMGLVNLTDTALQERHSIAEEELTGDAWGPCQALGRALRDEHPGVIAPCSALDGHANVTLFGPRRATDWRQRPGLANAVPTTVVAIGRPPLGLVDRVRHPAAGENTTPPLF